MEYSDDEICVMYRQAKDKAEQIKILAELNGTTKAEIKEILQRYGYIPVKKKKSKFNKISSIENEMMRLYKDGCTDLQIRTRLGISQTSLWNWRDKNNLKCNRVNKNKFDKNKLIELYEQGLSDTEIADNIGCNRQYVTNWRKREGFKNNKCKK